MIFSKNVPKLSVFCVEEMNRRAMSGNAETLAKLATSRGDRWEELPALLLYYVGCTPRIMVNLVPETDRT